MEPCRDRRVAELLPLYESGTLDANERMQVEQHLLGCEACTRELADYELITEAIRSHPETRQLLRDLAESAPLPSRSKSGWLAALLTTIRTRLRAWLLGWRKGMVVSPAYSEVEPEPDMTDDRRWVLSESQETSVDLATEETIEVAITLSSGIDPEQLAVRIIDGEGKQLHEQTGFDRVLIARLGIIEIDSTRLPSGSAILEVRPIGPGEQPAVGRAAFRVNRPGS